MEKQNVKWWKNKPQERYCSGQEPFLYNCSNISKLRMERRVGKGITKEVYQATDKGTKVAIKMVTNNVLDVIYCRQRLAKLKAKERPNECAIGPDMKLLKEIMLSQQLLHPNLVKLLGYCVRNEDIGPASSIGLHGVVGVFENGNSFYLSSLRNLTLESRLVMAMELADLFHYLENSPLGSLRVTDFKEEHFLMVKSKIKLTDLDDITNLEPKCFYNSNEVEGKMEFHKEREPMFNGESLSKCGFRKKCVSGVCLGYNAKYNLHHANRILFQNLLFIGAQEMGTNELVKSQVSSLSLLLNNLSLSSGDLANRLRNLIML